MRGCCFPSSPRCKLHLSLLWQTNIVRWPTIESPLSLAPGHTLWSLKSASFPYTFLDLFHSPEPSKLSISLYINCERASKMVFNYILCLLFDLDFCSFSCGVLPLSAAILWKSMLQASSRNSSHMGKSEMMWTWIVSYWLRKIHLMRLWSKVANWKSTIESHGDKTLFLITWRFVWPFLIYGRHINTCTRLHKPNPTSTLHRFTPQRGHDPRSLDVMVYVFYISIKFRELVIFPLL